MTICYRTSFGTSTSIKSNCMTTNEKAQKILSLINYREEAIARVVKAVAEIYMADDQLSDEELAEKNRVIQTVKDVANETVGYVMDQIVAVYSQHYSDSEMDELIVWYESDLGKKVLAESTTVFASVTNHMANWGDQLWKLVRIRMGWT